jgi:hypothetical protein
MVGHLALSKMARITDLRRATSIGWNLAYNLPVHLVDLTKTSVHISEENGAQRRTLTLAFKWLPLV